ncbi:DEAD/DEAH box helicase [Aquabacterium sp.]|uniref:DEAD/DEAH box helicase n=1 Tax=Aquabacterium sp. TaxID=1872578 RepID=UPI003BB1CB1E
MLKQPAHDPDLASMLLASGFNIVLQMPTGSGKTFRAAEAIRAACKNGLKAIYVTPTKALANELFERWTREWPGTAVGVFTGDYGKEAKYPVTFSAAEVFIMTPERLDLCTRQWRHHWGWLPTIDLLVVDEIHLLRDGSRGSRLEGAISRFRTLNPFARIAALSATLGNPHQLASWLEGVAHVSTERPINTKWRTELFAKADQKPKILLEVLRPHVSRGGKSIVFVQSKRRAELLTSFLVAEGIAAEHHHGGLSFDQRKDREERFRQKDFDVFVATGTLEVGLNLPVDQVVLYDLQQFDGAEFRPLSVISVWQRAGRAGRPGLQETAEVVMFRARWERDQKYEEGRFEDIRSFLHNDKALSEQVIVNISSGYARTRNELQTMAETTLAHRQVRLVIDQQIDAMCHAGFLVEDVDETKGITRLKATSLGRACNRLMIGHESVTQLASFLRHQCAWTHFDLLLACACLPDMEPVLPVDFEELDALTHLLTAQRSHLLTVEIHQLHDLLKVTPKRRLSAVKSALMLQMWAQIGDLDHVAEKVCCYPGDIVRARESMIRLLSGALAVTEDLVLRDPENSLHLSTVKQRIQRLQLMIDNGLNTDAATLTLVKGIGPTWARKLIDHGIDDVETLAQTEATALVAMGRISIDRAQQWITEATQLLSSDDIWSITDSGNLVQTQSTQISPEIDIYRYRRSLQLLVRKDENSSGWQVSGGTDPHLVSDGDSLSCDCMDYAKGHTCKHIIAVRRHLEDPDVLALDARLAEAPNATSIDLCEWWLK